MISWRLLIFCSSSLYENEYHLSWSAVLHSYLLPSPSHCQPAGVSAMTTESDSCVRRKYTHIPSLSPLLEASGNEKLLMHKEGERINILTSASLCFSSSFSF